MRTERNIMQDPDAKVQENVNAQMTTQAYLESECLKRLSCIRFEGEAALRRLLPIARRDTGQSRVITRFLLNLYNGRRFPFDLTDLRLLDYQIHEDCIAVLKMDFEPEMEVHMYFENGGAIWEALAQDQVFFKNP